MPIQGSARSSVGLCLMRHYIMIQECTDFHNYSDFSQYYTHSLRLPLTAMLIWIWVITILLHCIISRWIIRIHSINIIFQIRKAFNYILYITFIQFWAAPKEGFCSSQSLHVCKLDLDLRRDASSNRRKYVASVTCPALGVIYETIRSQCTTTPH